MGTGGLDPITDSEDVFGLGRGFRVSRKEALEEGVALLGENIDGKAPAVQLGELEDFLVE